MFTCNILFTLCTKRYCMISCTFDKEVKNSIHIYKYYSSDLPFQKRFVKPINNQLSV